VIFSPAVAENVETLPPVPPSGIQVEVLYSNSIAELAPIVIGLLVLMLSRPVKLTSVVPTFRITNLVPFEIPVAEIVSTLTNKSLEFIVILLEVIPDKVTFDPVVAMLW